MLRVCRECIKGAFEGDTVPIVPVLNSRHLGVSLMLKRKGRSDSDSQLPPPSAIDIIPTPGYVVKTYRVTNGEKVFINIAHHPNIRDDALILFCIIAPPEGGGLGDAAENYHAVDTTTVPVMYLGPPGVTTDKQVGDA